MNGKSCFNKRDWFASTIHILTLVLFFCTSFADGVLECDIFLLTPLGPFNELKMSSFGLLWIISLFMESSFTKGMSRLSLMWLLYPIATSLLPPLYPFIVVTSPSFRRLLLISLFVQSSLNEYTSRCSSIRLIFLFAPVLKSVSCSIGAMDNERISIVSWLFSFSTRVIGILIVLGSTWLSVIFTCSLFGSDTIKLYGDVVLFWFNSVVVWNYVYFNPILFLFDWYFLLLLFTIPRESRRNISNDVLGVLI